MASTAFTIFAGPPWRVGRAVHPLNDVQFQSINLPSAATPDQIAEAVAGALGFLGHRAGQEVLLALPSDWCLATGIEISELPKKDRRQAMLYRLEEKLPLAAEEFTADFVEGRKQALGVAVRTDLLDPVVAAFERCQIPVSVICPAALLVLPDFKVASDDDALFIQFDPERLDLLTRRDGDLAGWYALPATTRDIDLHLGILRATLGREALPEQLVFDPALQSHLAIRHPSPLVEAPRPYEPEEALTRVCLHSDSILRGSDPAPINLRRDALAPADAIRSYRTPLYAAVAGIALLLVSMMAVLFWRAHQYNTLAGQSEDRQRQLFTSAFPDQNPPAAIRSRLASEETRLRALGGVSSALPVEPPNLLVLRDALAALPPRVRYRLLEIRVDGNTFQIDGQALSHTDADTLASALRGNRRFTVDPPRTEQLASAAGVSFTLSGTVTAAPPEPAPRQQPAAQASAAGSGGQP